MRLKRAKEKEPERRPTYARGSREDCGAGEPEGLDQLLGIYFSTWVRSMLCREGRVQAYMVTVTLMVLQMLNRGRPEERRGEVTGCLPV